MKKFYFLITSSFALFISADTVLVEAKNMLDLDAKPIEVIYDNDLVTSVCPKGSVGCFINDKKLQFILGMISLKTITMLFSLECIPTICSFQIMDL